MDGWEVLEAYRRNIDSDMIKYWSCSPHPSTPTTRIEGGILEIPDFQSKPLVY
jgi:hypothetical protein